MDDGKPTGPKAKWWSRPASGRAIPQGPDVPEHRNTEETTELSPVTDEVPPNPDRPAVTEPVDSVPERVSEPDPDPGDHVLAPPERAPSAVSAAAASGADSTEAGTATAAATGAQGRPQPLHDPDPYSTPPYGGPGPWAPAPPVQRPVPTPAQGTPIPPQHYTGQAAPGMPGPQPASGYGVPPQ
ncbi:protease, partial [Streptomyces sp. PSRA5]